MTTSQIVMGYLSGLTILCMFIWFGVALYLAYRKTDMLLGLFPNSAGIKSLAELKNGGIWGKLMFIGGITSYVTFPKLYLKNGQLNHEDLETIPLSLKLKLAVMQWILLILVTAMFVLYFIGEAEFFN